MAVKVGKVAPEIAWKIRNWRETVLDRDYPMATFSDEGILPDETVDVLSAVGPILTRRQMDSIVRDSWDFYAKYAGELWALILSMSSTWPPFVPLPKKPRGRKRATEQLEVVAEEEGSAQTGAPDVSKRSRVARTAGTVSAVPSMSALTSGQRGRHVATPLGPVARVLPAGTGSGAVYSHVWNPYTATTSPATTSRPAIQVFPPWTSHLSTQPNFPRAPPLPPHALAGQYYAPSPYDRASLWPPPRPTQNNPPS